MTGPVTSYENQVPTGGAPLGTFTYFTFRCPNALWFISAILAQLVELNWPQAWAYVGEITPDEAAEAATQVYESLMQIYPLGTILPVAASVSQANLLACDGASYLRSDYPELFGVIGTTWGAVDSTHFSVPDLRGRSLVGAGTGSGLSARTLGQEFGEEAHTLVTSEMPAHTHAEGTTSPILVEAPVAPVPAAVGASGTTGATGGDGAHNNMQPSAVVAYYIIAR